MKFKDITWEPSAQRYVQGGVAKVGRVTIGGWHWNGIDKDPNLRYIATSKLPGIKSDLGKYPTEEEAKAKVEMGWQVFVKNITDNEV